MPIKSEQKEELFSEKVSIPKPVDSIAPGEIIIGNLAGINALGQPQVNFSLNMQTSPLTAITTLLLSEEHINRQVALLFNQGDLMQPIVIGLVHSPLQTMLDNYQHDSNSETDTSVELAANLDTDNVNVEGQKVIFEAQDEMVFKCGESSITLTKSGKVLIRGKYLLNRSTGVNRIMGGSVQVN